MEVILLEKVGKLGTVGDVVDVKAGFGRNYLLPSGKAITATKASIADFETRRAELEAAAAEKKTSAEGRAKLIDNLGAITIGANAGDEGKLFGSVGARDIANAITAAGVNVTKAEVKLPEGTLREVGEYEIDLQLHVDVTHVVKVVIVADANA
ncbi:50S ribosomal protein L9 [Saccharophagus degradans]|uniref:Large ribosomal subunit protein bL9 n=2 Tax=Saccharophagus degradans TaxID=86304 RepID=RL9_SACD2|nr:50S ribosomal protein L9 [Saccharophagus degradans]Q21LV8.1 RecName: Full=Large ribosomal subunit protein bL9; AltName: Full=50S ribosomal protein L9 [Saccharophagus degradans 2-40]ABD80321.1 LSU ribosomal protein L9P / transcriptional regulator, GntR family [Saccharophagus degradans 2-40]MBU2986079.1 50S ribosomal protein L9 [Saccharophagus degradans]MDO6423975.1 50S ribosomal protein L9 [Saccharophagus degradans]MDO6609186.1 50S ribosomal protein L9 [Saccharophagus degradans]WGO97502.1 5